MSKSKDKIKECKHNGYALDLGGEVVTMGQKIEITQFKGKKGWYCIYCKQKYIP